MTSPYKPVSFTSESINQQKLQQLAVNDQWLFENTARIRYSANGLVRDSGLKIISGRTMHAVEPGRNFTYQNVYFGSFFSAGCKPVVTASVEVGSHRMHRNKISLQSLSGPGSPLDHTGFMAIVSTEATNDLVAGAIHWIAVGY